MKTLKKVLFAMAVTSAISAFTACTTTVPGYAQGNFPHDSESYQVLGRITVHFETGKAAYYKLVEEAQKQYPGADDVVNIMCDVENNTDYILSGIAIKYKK